jgi:hypothetical protein
MTSVSGSTIGFSYISSNGATGTGTATTGTAATVGSNGLTIAFSTSSTYSTGDEYQIRVGAQNANSMILDNSLGAASITSTVSDPSAPPTFANDIATVAGGGTTYGASVPFLSAPSGAGMGEYKVTPQAVISTDVNSWAASYTADVEYSIASGPTTTSVSASTAPTLPIFQGSTASLEPGWSLQPLTYSYLAGSFSSPLDDGGWAEAVSPGSVSYAFSVASGQYTTIMYGIPAGGYQDNAKTSIYVNGALQYIVSNDLGGGGAQTSTQEDLWSETFGPGVYKLMFTSSGSPYGTNVYGLWASNPSAITPH